MKLREWLTLVGKNYDTPEIAAVRTAFGLTGKGPRLASGFGSEAIPAAGLTLMLDKANLIGTPNKKVYGLAFHGRPDADRVPYTEALPHALKWDEDQAAVRARLGMPVRTAQLANSDGYTFGDYDLSVEYEPDGSRIRAVQLRLSKHGGSALGADAG
jgi:hypothetical protein